MTPTKREMIQAIVDVLDDHMIEEEKDPEFIWLLSEKIWEAIVEKSRGESS